MNKLKTIFSMAIMMLLMVSLGCIDDEQVEQEVETTTTEVPTATPEPVETDVEPVETEKVINSEYDRLLDFLEKDKTDENELDFTRYCSRDEYQYRTFLFQGDIVNTLKENAAEYNLSIGICSMWYRDSSGTFGQETDSRIFPYNTNWIRIEGDGDIRRDKELYIIDPQTDKVYTIDECFELFDHNLLFLLQISQTYEIFDSSGYFIDECQICLRYGVGYDMYSLYTTDEHGQKNSLQTYKFFEEEEFSKRLVVV